MNLVLLCTMAFAIKAQTFNGVQVGGTLSRPTIVNQSSKPVIGYAIQITTTTRANPVFSDVDFDSIAAGKPIQPGEERPLKSFPVFPNGGRGVGEHVSNELKAVLFADGTFQGPDAVFLDFSKRLSVVKGVALSFQGDPNRYRSLEEYSALLSKDLRRPIMGADVQAADRSYAAAKIIFEIRDQKGESGAEAALNRLASLPEVARGRAQ
jgi:hypothetical protein